MSYLENVLVVGEQVVLYCYLYWNCLIWFVVVLVLLIGLVVFGFGFVNLIFWQQIVKNVIYVVIWGIWLVIVGWFMLWLFLSWLIIYFVVINWWVMFWYGVLICSGIDILLVWINSVEFWDWIFEWIFCIGMLIIEFVL